MISGEEDIEQVTDDFRFATLLRNQQKTLDSRAVCEVIAFEYPLSSTSTMSQKTIKLSSRGIR